ncbi:MAG: hypothetical protein WBF83_01755 [Moheibacter sp.]
MKKLILMMGVLVGMIGCSENEDVFEYQKLNSGESINYYQKELAEPNDTIRIDNPTEPNGGGGDDDPPPTGIKDGTKKEKQNDSIIVILP